ncbi:MAG: DUF4190 domain-containing protein [Treponema sp.]|nr:DUF4190 domain-containing protein [Treponema sp.]
MSDEIDRNADPWNVTGSADHGQQGAAPAGNQGNPPQGAITSDDLGTASLIFGILAFFMYKGVFSIVGLVLGIISVRRHKTDRAIAGIICSAINIAIIIMSVILLGCALCSLLPRISEAMQKLFF